MSRLLAAALAGAAAAVAVARARTAACWDLTDVEPDDDDTDIPCMPALTRGRP